MAVAVNKVPCGVPAATPLPNSVALCGAKLTIGAGWGANCTGTIPRDIPGNGGAANGAPGNGVPGKGGAGNGGTGCCRVIP